MSYDNRGLCAAIEVFGDNGNPIEVGGVHKQIVFRDEAGRVRAVRNYDSENSSVE